MLMLFLTVAMVHIVALMSPGPDFFFVSQTAVSRSRKEAMMGVLGITCGVMVWAGIALLGLHLIYSAAIFLIPICISFDTAEKRRYATYLILNRRFSFEF